MEFALPGSGGFLFYWTGFIFAMKYYLHDTSAMDDEKVTELYMKFGYEGVGLFYVILEKLGKQEKPMKTEVLKAQLKVGKRLEKCWTFMEQIGIISSNNGETFNKQLLNFSEKYQIKKEKTREKVSQWRKKQDDAESVTGYVPISNPRKVKKSKVKENKDIKGEPGKPADFIDLVIDCFIKEHGNYEIINRGKEREMAGKILSQYKKKYPEAESEEVLNGLKDYFHRCVNINDQWLSNNMSLSIIVSKFNEINKVLKNGRAKESGATAEQFRQLLPGKLGIEK